MLDLNSARWRELRHAYGAADDIPALIEQLKTDPLPKKLGLLRRTVVLALGRPLPPGQRVPSDLQDWYAAALVRATDVIRKCLALDWDEHEYRVLLGGWPHS